MLLFLSKFLALLFYPIGLLFAGAACGAAAAFCGKKKIALWCAIAPLMILWFFSTPFIADAFVRSLEKKFDPPSSFPKVPAIVVLGGATQPAISPRKYPETNVFGDRMFHAVRLAKAGYAPYIICSGGKIKFLLDHPGSEAQTMSDILQEFGGIDPASIIIEDQAQNTYENGTKIKELFEKRGFPKEIILVTSALHMYRSVKIYQKCGFTVFPAPTDYWVNTGQLVKLFDLLPSADALCCSTAALHEYYGLLAYWMLGRL